MKNEIITIYELMGLIKDSKAPKKIKYDDNIFNFDFETNNYRDNEMSFLFGDYIYGQLNLNDTVEILPEENDEWENIKEITEKTIGDMENCFIYKINQLIKNQKYLKEKIDKCDREN